MAWQLLFGIKTKTMNKILKNIMLSIARNAISEKLFNETLINRDELTEKYPELAEKGAVFVTLNKEGQLRGCIGSIEAHRPLIDDIIHNAQAAAFQDYRFTPVEAGEIDDISIEISLLTPPEKVEYNTAEELENILTPYKDGIILVKGFNRAVFLPQVWEKLPDFEMFFKHLCLKAGLSENCIYQHPEIYRFEVEIFEEQK